MEARNAGMSFSFGPKGGKEGPFVQLLNSPEKTVRFGNGTLQPEPLQKLDAYTSGWAESKKAMEYANSNLAFSCKCSSNPEEFYVALALKLIQKNIELQTKRFRMQSDDVGIVAAIAPASASFDGTAAALWFLTNHRIYVNFATASVNKETHTWKDC